MLLTTCTVTVIVFCGRVTESTRAKIDFYSERLKQLAGTSFTKLAAPPPAQAEAEQPPTVSSSSKEEDKENAFEEKTFDDNKISESKDVEQCAKTKPPPSEAGQQAELCVPDSSVAEEEAGEEAEQLSSGSVDEELLEEDTDQGDTKTAEPEPEGGAKDQAEANTEADTKEAAGLSPQQSLVGELMNRFGFSDILEYQEAYRRAVQESGGAGAGAETEPRPRPGSGLKLRSDITIDSAAANFAHLSKSELFKNFETLKRLRPELNGSGAERESLFAGG